MGRVATAMVMTSPSNDKDIAGLKGLATATGNDDDIAKQ